MVTHKTIPIARCSSASGRPDTTSQIIFNMSAGASAVDHFLPEGKEAE